MIKINNLKKTFIGATSEQTVLEDVDLHIQQGQIMGIIGLSGAGKSTLLRCIGGLEKATEGKVIVNTNDVAALSERERISHFKQIGTIFQGYNLMMQRTVAQNVALPLEIDYSRKKDIKARVQVLLELVGLEDKADAYPATLSGGQRQRVAIARALANEPKLLLCDEPTSALDCITTRSILSLLEEINRTLGVTIVIITHDIDVVRQICHQVIVMHDGQVVESGEVTEVLAQPQHQMTQAFLGEGGRL